MEEDGTLESSRLIKEKTSKGRSNRTETIEKAYILAIATMMAMLSIVMIGTFRFSLLGYGIVTAHGTSMYPTIKDGDRCILNNNIPEGNLTGLIIVFSGHRICHRCIIDSGEWLTFQGDNSSSQEHATRDELKAIFIKVTDNSFFDMIALGLG